jgi:ubiquinone biosynthesis protein
MSTVYVSIGVIVLAALVVRRLLGIRRGRWTITCVAVILGQAATIGILQVVTGHVLHLGWVWVPVGCALVAALSMLAFVLLELLTPARRRRGSRRLPRPVAALRRSARYVQVSWIAVRKGLLRAGDDDSGVTGSRLGRALAATFEEAGGLFVKLGQAMAAQPQLVTPAVAAELARLQEQAAPADPAAALAVLHEEIGPPDEVFAEFAPDPVAAASIGQTYFATLRDGRDVVVKVQRPGIAELVERDLDILVRLVDRLEYRTAWAKSLGLKELTAGFAESTREELDFRIEAVNAATARADLQPTDPITVPQIMDEFTSRRVLVQERVDGHSVGAPGILDDLDAAQRQTLADALLSLLIRQMIGGQRFHADPHPGNVFLRSDGRLALIDFGAVGRLNRLERAGLIDIFRALQTDDPSLLRQAALQIGTPSERIDTEALDRELARLMSRNVEPGVGLKPTLFSDIVAVFRDFGIFLPRSTLTLFRTILTVLGTLEVISPGYDVPGAMQRLGGEVTAAVKEMTSVQDVILSTAPVLARLPRDLDDAARSLLCGQLRARVSLLSEPEDVLVARGMLNRLLMGLIGSALALASAILLTVPTESGQSLSLVSIIGGTGLSVSALLLLRLIVQILREQRLTGQ